MAETWLSEHDYHEFTVEDAEIEEKSRTFGYQFVNLGGKIEHTPEGGLRVKGVKLLAAGTWTDSAQKTACEYSPEVLKQFSSNWIDNAIWSRHFGGVPRNITEKVGIVENQRYENEAVVGDLYYHGLTGQSRDTIAMIDNGLANYVSVETVSKDKWNVGKKVYQAQELGFTGLATVNQGACRVCKIRENGGPGSGNFDHAGIPGQQGGSAPGGGGGPSIDQETGSLVGIVSGNHFNMDEISPPDGQFLTSEETEAWVEESLIDGIGDPEIYGENYASEPESEFSEGDLLQALDDDTGMWIPDFQSDVLIPEDAIGADPSEHMKDYDVSEVMDYIKDTKSEGVFDTSYDGWKSQSSLDDAIRDQAAYQLQKEYDVARSYNEARKGDIESAKQKYITLALNAFRNARSG
ncbi:MAG: hypothetical protein PHS80_00190 [Methanothrix sp.]|nr:hypothetical protein [Methanothrix sp.]